MGFDKKSFWIKLTHWEYWPFPVLYFPVFIYWGWLVIKSRSVFFFSASNPSIENGGMLGESKSKIFALIPDKWKPVTLLFEPNASKQEILNQISKHHIKYPFILKPDIGERGSFVEKIDNESQLETYLKRIKVNFLLQEYVEFPLELGVFYYRIPGNTKGTVSSIVVKDFLTVTGDGELTLEELILKYPRARLQYEALKEVWNQIWNELVPAGETRLLMPIGNHSRGTTFLNGQHLISEEFINVVDNIAKSIDGFFFGRIDMRCLDEESMKKGEQIKILELNGAGSEPGHIYQPGTSIFTAYKAILFHLNILQKISSKNHRRGIPYMSFSEGIREIRKLKAYNKIKNS